MILMNDYVFHDFHVMKNGHDFFYVIYDHYLSHDVNYVYYDDLIYDEIFHNLILYTIVHVNNMIFHMKMNYLFFYDVNFYYLNFFPYLNFFYLYIIFFLFCFSFFFQKFFFTFFSCFFLSFFLFDFFFMINNHIFFIFYILYVDQSFDHLIN